MWVETPFFLWPGLLGLVVLGTLIWAIVSDWFD